MRRFLLAAMIVVAAVLFVTPPGALAAGKTNLVMIFDASGSMWGQIDGKAKITIAKEAMDLIVGDLPPDINIGLVAYGHRRKGDCDDVETLIPLGPLNPKAFMAKINALNPKGKTPMVRSIRKTAESIKHLEDETTILLVSDGIETCDPDPCGFVAELEKLGIKFVLHVVGFDVGGEAEAQLKCMAKAGGGEYFPAKDAGKLKEALDTVIEKTVEKNLKVSIFLNGKPIGGSVEVTAPATGDRVAHIMRSEPKPILMGVTPGTYRVTVADEWKQEGRPTLVFENVQINESEVREITANFGSGTLTIWTYQNGKPFKARTRLSDMDDQTVGGGYATTYPDKPAKYVLQPGKYKLMAEDSWGAGTRKDLGIVEVLAGQTVEKKVSFDTGKLRVWNYKNGKPFKGRARLSTLDGNSLGYETTYPDKPAEYVLEPGQYKLMAEDSWGAGTRQELGTIEIVAGQTLEKKVSFDSGKLVVWTYRGGKPFHASVRVSTMDNKTMGGGWGTTYPDRPETYELVPGRYNVEAEDSWGDPVVKLKFGTVEIKAGETLNRICDFDSPPSQSAAPAAAAVAASAAGAASSTSGTAASTSGAASAPLGQPVSQPPGLTAASPKQTARETVPQADSGAALQASTTTNPQDMQAMAAQMEAMGQAQAAQAQADAMAQMQAAMAQMQGNQLPQSPQTPAQQAAASGQQARPTTSGTTTTQTVRPTTSGATAPALPPGVGAQHTGTVGAPPSNVDYSNVGAREPEGGMGEEAPSDDGHNPYAGMSKEEMQAAFANDMGMQGPQGVAYDKTDWQLGRTYVLQCKRYEDTLNNRLDSYTEQAQSMGRQDILERIKVARANLKTLGQQRKQRVSRDVLQQTLDRCVQEIHAINVTIAQGQ